MSTPTPIHCLATVTGSVLVPLHSPHYSPIAWRPARDASHGRGGEAVLSNVSRLGQKAQGVTERDRESKQEEPGVRSSPRAAWVLKTTLHTLHANFHIDLRPLRAMPIRKYNTCRQGMEDCSTPQPKCPGGHAANLSAEREPEEAEPLSEQAAAQVQARPV
ncbi:hypothetical protein NDU88_006632 [Pleurodeles waltl]|uniref:Uncharacterized protein n=1 Tax=Pleurodeles waltl TaxID=8319 RepID=A0AAV7X244_PLEWA|nr:hypothetical protein NDU88_006632 [Pleurodeles waltl]